MTIFKLVTCQVEKDRKQNFSCSQLAWEELKNCEGFGGQFGGWSKSEEQAIILGVWQSHEHVQAFMESVHDDIFFKSGQQSTYKKCDIHYYEKILDIPSLANNFGIKNNSVFRLAYCRGVQDVERFFRDQRNTWNVHMGKATGMLGGCVIRSLKQSDYFVVITYWASNEDHENYVNGIFLTLKNQVSPKEYIENLSGCIIQEECSWKVAPNKAFKSDSQGVAFLVSGR